MRRILFAALALVMAAGMALVPSRDAHADDWCWGDPIVSIGGKQVNIIIGVQGSWTQVANHVERAHTKVYVPYGVSTSLVGFTPAPFTETVEFIPVTWLSATSTTINVAFEVTFYRKPLSSTSPTYRLAEVDIVQNFKTTNVFPGQTNKAISGQFKVSR